MESLAAEERRQSTLKQNTTDKENFPERTGGQTRDIVAEQIGIGSGKQFEKAKFIDDNADAETIAKLDAEKDIAVFPRVPIKKTDYMRSRSDCYSYSIFTTSCT